ncbi:MAG: hypothetical protein GYA02_03055 [Clostridiaceae bacterium]|nr:hypothetical protein [Clostridiaceae bacterium]
MNNTVEFSCRDENTISIWPQHLLCMRCMNGGGKLPFMEEKRLREKLDLIKSKPIVFLHLQAAFDEIGARTDIFREQNHIERKRDLDVLQKLGLTPGSVRLAKDLFRLVEERIPTLKGICIYENVTPGKWDECPLAREKYFEDGKDNLVYKRIKEEMVKAKIDSCKNIESMDRIYIRAHHMLCIFCFVGKKTSIKPIEEDNLYEVWKKMKDNPKIPVTLAEGCSSCMICPPCHGFEPERGICNAGCHLRDRKKDLDVFQRLGLIPGDTLLAEDLILLIYEKIPTVKGICEYGASTSPEWDACGGTTSGNYEKRCKIGLFQL